MSSERKGRWKHTDTHADLRAFLGDAASLFTEKVRLCERGQRLTELTDRYGLSNSLVERAVAALELSGGDSRVAYELIAQWSLTATDGVPQADLNNVALRPTPVVDDQNTHEGEIQLEEQPLQPFEVDPTTPLAVLSKQFAAVAANTLQTEQATASDLAEVQQHLVTQAVREFGLTPETAREVLSQLTLPPATQPQDSPSLVTSPDTLPDLDSIIAEEADWLDFHRAHAEQVKLQDEKPASNRDLYRQYVDERLAAISGNQVDAHQWKKLYRHGTTHYAMTSADAAHLIEERAHRCQKQVLTPQRAFAQLAKLATALRNRHGRITLASKSRLTAAALQLGLPTSAVRQVLLTLPPGETVAVANGQPRYRLLLAVSASAACAMLTFFLWVAVSQRSSGPLVVVAAPQTEEEERNNRPTANRFIAPTWWNESTIAAARHVSANETTFDDQLRGFSDPSPTERRAAALAFLQGLDFSAPAFSDNSKQYSQLIVGFLALEPNETAAVDTFRDIASTIKGFAGTWPASDSVHRAMFWQLDCLLSAVESPLTSSQRAAAFTTALNDVLQISVGASEEIAVWRNACTLAVTQRCYGMLMNSINRTPTAILAARQSLAVACMPRLPAGHVARLDTKLLCQLLADGRDFNDFAQPIRERIESPDTLNALRFVAIYEQIPETHTRKELGQLLLERAGLRSAQRTPQQTARAVRAALEHGSPGDRYADRWEHFMFTAERMAHREQEPSQELELSKAVINVAHHNLLGMALALQNRSGREAFDQHAGEGAPQLVALAHPHSHAIVPPAPMPRAEELPPHVAKELLSRVHGLSSLLPRHEQEYHWEIAVRIIHRWNELPPPVAGLLCRYLLSPLDPRTETVVVSDSLKMLPLVDFQLALAEAIEQSKLDDAALAARLSTLLGRRITIQSSEDRTRLRYSLLSNVYKDLAPPRASVAGQHSPLAQLREQLTRLYQAKALLADVSPGAFLTATNPADMLDAIILQDIADHAASNQTGEHWAQTELSAARFRSGSELEATVLLQQLRVRMLAEQLQADLPAGKSTAELLATPYNKATAAGSLLQQLYWGEIAELQLWLARHGAP